jgi:hypothetical protein
VVTRKGRVVLGMEVRMRMMTGPRGIDYKRIIGKTFVVRTTVGG